MVPAHPPMWPSQLLGVASHPSGNALQAETNAGQFVAVCGDRLGLAGNALRPHDASSPMVLRVVAPWAQVMPITLGLEVWAALVWHGVAVFVSRCVSPKGPR